MESEGDIGVLIIVFAVVVVYFLVVGGLVYMGVS
jgi:hypothetical protein